MESASRATYLSKKAMDAYAKKRQDQMVQKQAISENVIGIKNA